MARTNFIPRQTLITADWLNRVDEFVEGTLEPQASDVENTPSGNITATNVQAAINELDNEKTSAAALAASTGALLVGTANGTTVQQALAARPTYAGLNVVSALDAGLVVGEPSAYAANTALLATLISQLNDAGGGRLILPEGNIWAAMDIKYPRIEVYGCGLDTLHDAGTSFGTRLVAGASGTHVKIRTPYAAEQGIAAGSCFKNTGAKLIGVSLIGNGVGSRALEIDSVSLIDVDVYATGYTGPDFYYITCGITGTDLGEACDVQYSRINLRARAIDTVSEQAAHVCVLTGSVNANVSLNRLPLHGISVTAQHKDGNVLQIISADNNDIFVNGGRASGGTGRLALNKAPTVTNPVGSEANRFVFATGLGGLHNEGTDTVGATAATYNEITGLDTANGTPLPTSGTGSVWVNQDVAGVQEGLCFNKGVAIGDTRATAITARTALGSTGLRIFNGSENHIRLTDGTNEWAFGIGGGNLRFVRISGTGALNIGGNIVAFSKVVSEGPADSGGVGFKILRVPN